MRCSGLAGIMLVHKALHSVPPGFGPPAMQLRVAACLLLAGQLMHNPVRSCCAASR